MTLSPIPSQPNLTEFNLWVYVALRKPELGQTKLVFGIKMVKQKSEKQNKTNKQTKKAYAILISVPHFKLLTRDNVLLNYSSLKF